MSVPAFVIEAPGKTVCVAAVLGQLGVASPAVFATRGHLKVFPRTFDPIGVDEHFHPVGRAIRDPKLSSSLCCRLRDFDRIFVLTDMDDEGDLIARDIHELLLGSGYRGELLHAPLSGLDVAGIAQAIDRAQPLAPDSGLVALSRTILDRVISATFSAKGLVVGRVFSPLLARLAAYEGPCGDLELHLPARHRRSSFLATIPVAGRAEANRLIALAAASRPVPTIPAARAVHRPLNTADALRLGEAHLRMPFSDTAAALQASYEAGHLSYPRTSSRSFRPSAAQPHTALEPLGPIRCDVDPTKQDRVEAVLQIVARRHRLAADFSGIEVPDPEHLPAWAQGHVWWRYDDAAPPWASGFQEYSVERVALDILEAERLGRPSSFPSITERLTRLNLARKRIRGEGLVLTFAGERALDQTPAPFHDAALARLVATTLGVRDREPDRPLGASIGCALEVYGDAVRDRVMAALKIEKPVLSASPVVK